RLRAQLEPLDASLQPIPGCDRGLAPSRRVGELILGAGAVGEQALEPRLCTAPREGRSVAPCLDPGARLCRAVQVELRDARPQRVDLPSQLLRALCGRRLQSEWTEPLAHLLLDVARAFDLQSDPGELQLCPMAAALELPQAR